MRLRTTDPGVRPQVDFRMLTDPGDLPRLVEGLQLVMSLAGHRAFAASYQGIGLLESPSADDRNALESYIRSTVGGWYHASGTCRMGTDPDDGAVVDGRLQVHGVDALHVVDASVDADRRQGSHQPEVHRHRRAGSRAPPVGRRYGGAVSRSAGGGDVAQFRSIEVEPLSPALGAVVEGLDLGTAIDETQAADLRDASTRHLVLFFRGFDVVGGAATGAGVGVRPAGVGERGPW